MKSLAPKGHRKTRAQRERLADYATAFDFLGRLEGTTTEEEVVEHIFDLFSVLFTPKTIVYLFTRRDQKPIFFSRLQSPIDLESARKRLMNLSQPYAWTSSGEGFTITFGQEGYWRNAMEVEGVAFPEFLEHYLNLVLNLVPVLSLALANARNFQTLRNALATRDTMLSVVSHDLRSPLRTISINSELMRKRCAGHATQDCVETYTLLIQESVSRMSSLISNLLDFGRMDAGLFSIQTGDYPIQEILECALREIRPQAEKRGIRLELQSCENVLIQCDRDRILQVLVNFLSNAIRFAPEQSGWIGIRCENQNSQVHFSISDNGPGILPDEIPHLFDRYWQGSQNKGSVGLGLSIAQGIVKAHGGEIGVESTLGQGTTFYFTLPKDQGPF